MAAKLVVHLVGMTVAMLAVPWESHLVATSVTLKVDLTVVAMADEKVDQLVGQ